MEQQEFGYKSFKGYNIVSCGTLRPELDFLKEKGFLNADNIIYTAPGLHETPRELEKQLKKQINNAKKYSHKIIVVYGDRCYIDTNDPSRDIDKIIQETCAGAKRIQAKNCIDMFAGLAEREKVSKGQKVYWLSPGWLKYWKAIFRDWDRGKANETFPQHDKAVLLDPIGIFEKYSSDSPEKLLELADWMNLNVEPYEISLNRFRSKLLNEVS
jgi:hypothetical protein